MGILFLSRRFLQKFKQIARKKYDTAVNSAFHVLDALK